ncbi:hypothetical protein BDY21DRAFT_287967 [Lineolata rhizophorae]|uniref:Inactive metallocarboxypeptidase ECM14 n=1 Tax=Lineolata rhizophorae TaxID=578093 RepID=A0A6A6NXH2_9PEZI|nr:hypothetical protein BDY21DRAFT_287967 [Lineolata rhizophorae]
MAAAAAGHVSVAESALNGGGRGSPSGKLMAQYEQDVVLRFNISSADEAVALAEAADVLFLDVWEFTGNWVDIRLSKDVVPSLLGLLPASLQNAHAPLMHGYDLVHAIFDTYPTPHDRRERRLDSSFTPHFRTSSSPPSSESPDQQDHSESNIFFRDYQPLSVIHPWLQLLQSLFPTHVRVTTVGVTYEGRDIEALRVGASQRNPAAAAAARGNDDGGGPRPTILIAGGSHAREWIATSTVTYVAYGLVTRYGKDAAVTALVDAFDWVLVPSLNPDGYAYSWERDRLWRKNRQPTPSRFCRGVDLDRAYGFHWGGGSGGGGGDGGGAGGNACSESFAGAAPFDGVEAARFAGWARNETAAGRARFVAFVDLHSYAQEVLFPYSYSCGAAPPTLENLEEVALGLAKAIRLAKGGRVYQTMPACEGNVAAGGEAGAGKGKVLPRIESGGGSALDWFYAELGVRYSFQLKLRDTGSYGFLLPRENIVPTGKEVLDAMLYLGRFLAGDLGLGLRFEEDGSEGEGGEGEETGEENAGDGADDGGDWDGENVEWELRRRRRR